ncbi:amidotransferase [candidate division KSB1 bacterium]|nr:amidotransferase [candidate division KSB1 bacterium]
MKNAKSTVLALKHVSFEGPGAIAHWVDRNGLNLELCPWYKEPDVRPPEAYAAIVIMGGPMNVHETDAYPWLLSELDYLKRALVSSVPMLGICLGAQLLALALGANVTRNASKEIGWFEVKRHPLAESSPVLQGFPETFMTMHWHGDTFSLPVDALPVGSSTACQNQGFVWQNRVVGIQFHPEFTESGLESIIDQCRDELIPDPYIQSEQQILANSHLLPEQHKMLYRLLDRLFTIHTESP